MPTTPNFFFKIGIRILAVCIFFGLWIFLFVRFFSPSGSLSVTTDFIHPTPFLSIPLSSERLALPFSDQHGNTLTPLISDRVYVDFTPSSLFSTITATLRYRNQGQPLLEFGGLGSTLDDQFDLHPIENTLINSLPWARVSDGTTTLLQRIRRFSSLNDFFQNPPDVSHIAVYHAAPALPFVIQDYTSVPADREINVSLRGHHRFLTYVKNEPLQFTFIVQDMNRGEGADPVIVSVYRGGDEKVVARTILEDDGKTSDNQHSSPLRQVSLSMTAPPEGVYKIEFTASDDIFIRKIITRQQKLVMNGKLYLGDHVGFSDETKPITVFTSGMRLVARVVHADFLQSLVIDQEKLTIDQPQVRFFHQFQSRKNLAEIISPKRDILLETDGMFAFSKEEFFDPLPLSLEWYTSRKDLDVRGIDNIIMISTPTSTEGDITSAKVKFFVDHLAKTKDGAYRFVLDAPGLVASHQNLALASLTFTMERESIAWYKLIFPQFITRWRSEQELSPLLVLPNGTSYGEIVQ